MNIQGTTDELLHLLGRGIKTTRLLQNLGQSELAAQAGVSRSAVQNLETGRGTVETLVRVVRALGRDDWLLVLGATPSINPLHVVAKAKPRQRASRTRHGDPTHR